MLPEPPGADRKGPLPRALFVLGKGGVGRSTIAAALGLSFARRGEETLVVQWCARDAIGPWFGQPPARHAAQRLAPHLSVMNFSLDEALREYFVDHLHMRLLHRLLIARPPLRPLIGAAPGLAELFFCGRLFWLLELARGENGADYRRIVIDAPATGHGVALLALPRMLASFQASGLFSLERGRVTRLFADPALTGAVVVTDGEELALDETGEILQRLGAELGRQPIALVLNRSVDRLIAGAPRPEWLAGLRAEGVAQAALQSLYADLLRRKERERALALAAPDRTCLVDDGLLALEDPAPRAIVERAAASLEELWP